jgi:hypothetical protein
MYDTKYIVIKNLDGEPTIYLFPNRENHRQTAMKLTGGNLRDVISAGFCGYVDGLFMCYGESSSLDIPSRYEIDTQLLNSLIGR